MFLSFNINSDNQIGVFIKAFICLFLVLMQTIAQASDSLLIVSGEFDPYVGEKLPKNGFSTEIVKAAFASVNKEIQIDFVPWARAMVMLKNNQCAGSYPWFKTAEREKILLYSAPIHTTEAHFFGRTDSDFNKTQNWNGKKLCQPLEWSGDILEVYIKKYNLKIERARSMESCLEMIRAGRVDLTYVDDHVGKKAVKSLFGENSNIGPVGEIKMETKFYFVVPKNNPNAESIMNEFNSGLAKIIKNGQFQKIMKASL